MYRSREAAIPSVVAQDSGAITPRKREFTPIRERWLVKMFSPPSIDKVGHAANAHFYGECDDYSMPDLNASGKTYVNVSRLRQPTNFS